MRDQFDLVFVILFILLVLASLVSRADTVPAPPTCDTVLSACDQDVQRLKKQLAGLKDDVAYYKKEATKVAGQGDRLVLSVVTGAVAGALGGAAADGKTGLAPGGMAGAAVGLFLGEILK